MPRLSPSATAAERKATVKHEMEKFKAGTLHSGSSSGPKVKSRKQAIAIAMSVSGQSKKRKKKS